MEEDIRELQINLESDSKIKASSLPRDSKFKRFFQVLSYRKNLKSKSIK